MRNRILILGVMMLLAATVAIAGGEQSKGGKMDPAAKAASFKEKLGLTDEQTQKVQAVFEASQKRHDELKASGAQGDALAAEKKKIRTDEDAKLKEILSPEQWASLEKWRSEKPKQQATDKPQQ